ncbi:MAG: hypothetical protein ABDI20_08035 [Candidatus Bipolaricaulaceae bacterium]
MFRRHALLLGCAALPLVLLELGLIYLNKGAPPFSVAANGALRHLPTRISWTGIPLYLFLMLAVYPLLNVGLSMVTYALFRGSPASLHLLFLPVLRKPWAVLRTTWSVHIRVALASLLLIVPGILRGLSLLFAPFLALARPGSLLNAVELSEFITQGWRGRLFLLSLFFTLLEALTEIVVAIFLDAGHSWLGLALWLSSSVVWTAWLAGAEIAAFLELLGRERVFAESVTSDLDELLAGFAPRTKSPVWVTSLLLGSLGVMVYLWPKAHWRPPGLWPVTLLPPPPPPAGALAVLGKAESIKDVAILPDEQRIVLLTPSGIEVRALPDLTHLFHVLNVGDIFKMSVSPKGELVATRRAMVDLEQRAKRLSYELVNAVAFGPAGELLRAWPERHESHKDWSTFGLHVSAHDPCTGAELWHRTWTASSSSPLRIPQIEELALSPQGNFLLVTFWDDWEPVTYVYDLFGETPLTKAWAPCVWSKDEKLLVASEGDVLIKDPRTNQVIQRFERRKDQQILPKHGPKVWLQVLGTRARRASLSADGRYLAAFDRYERAWVWDLKGGQLVLAFAPHATGFTRTLDFPRLRLGGIDVPIPHATLTTSYGEFASPWTLYLSASGRLLALANPYGLVLVDVATGDYRRWGAREVYEAPLWLPDGRTAVDEHGIVWDTEAGIAKGRLPEARRPLAVDRNGKILLQCHAGLCLWCSTRWREQAVYEFRGSVAFAEFTKENDVVIVTHEEKDCWKFLRLSLPQGTVMTMSTLAAQNVTTLSPYGRLAAFKTLEKLGVVEVSSGEILWERSMPEGGRFLCSAFSHDEELLALGFYRPPAIFLVNLATGEERQVADLAPAGLAFHPQAPILAALTFEDGLVFLDVHSGAELLRFPEAQAKKVFYDPRRSAVSFAPDGTRVATVGPYIIVWPVPLASPP